MMRGLFQFVSRVPVILALLALAALGGSWQAERIGDRLQVALPLVAWACTATKGEGAEYLLRYTVMFVTAHGAKTVAGDSAINRRPSGGTDGFPSAHTSTAVLGASRLVHDCVRAHPLGQAAILLAAAFVGGSRIDAKKHDIWQVLAGALLGYAADRVLRRPSAARTRTAALLRRIGAALLAAFAAARAGLRRLRQGPGPGPLA